MIGQTIGESIAGRIGGTSAGGQGATDDEHKGGLFSAIGDFLGLDGKFGYNGVDGPDGNGRHLSLGGLAHSVEGAVDAVGDTLGFDGQFGHQGREGRSLSLSNLGNAFSGRGGEQFRANSSAIIGDVTLSGGASNALWTPNAQGPEVYNDEGYLMGGAPAGFQRIQSGSAVGQMGGAQGPYDIDLWWNEALGGHVIQYHVGRSLESLASRGKTVSSAFFDLGTAEQAINEALNDARGQATIQQLLATSAANPSGRLPGGQRVQAEIRVTYARPVGNDQYGNFAQGAIIVLRPTTASRNGFYVLTAYPTGFY